MEFSFAICRAQIREMKTFNDIYIQTYAIFIVLQLLKINKYFSFCRLTIEIIRKWRIKWILNMWINCYRWYLWPCVDGLTRKLSIVQLCGDGRLRATRWEWDVAAFLLLLGCETYCWLEWSTLWSMDASCEEWFSRNHKSTQYWRKCLIHFNRIYIIE